MHSILNICQVRLYCYVDMQHRNSVISDYHVYTKLGSVHRQGMQQVRWALLENGSGFMDMYPKLTLKQCKEEDGCHAPSYSSCLEFPTFDSQVAAGRLSSTSMLVCKHKTKAYLRSSQSK